MALRRSFNGTYPITRPFGFKDPAYANYPDSRHPGTDYALPPNTPLVAGMSGVVVVYDRPAGVHVGRGKEVVITQGTTQRKTCHMNRIDVETGQWVNEGQPIGLSGYTGYVVDAQGNIGTPEGAHLHDETVEDGTYVDGEQLIKEEPMTLQDKQWLSEELHKRDLRMDKFFEGLDNLYKIADSINSNLSSLYQIVNKGDKDSDNYAKTLDETNRLVIDTRESLDKLKEKDNS